jgi:hypothetical protein
MACLSMYIQQFFFHLWDEKELNMEIINKVEGRILERHENEFLNQHRFSR